MMDASKKGRINRSDFIGCLTRCGIHVINPKPHTPKLNVSRFNIKLPADKETGDAACVMCHTSHVTRHTSHVTRHTSHVT